MTEQQREAFSKLVEAVGQFQDIESHIARMPYEAQVDSGAIDEHERRHGEVVRLAAALSHAEGEAPEIEPGTPVMTPDGPAVVQKLYREVAGSRDWWVRFVMGIERWYAEKNLQVLVPGFRASAPQVAVPEGWPTDDVILTLARKWFDRKQYRAMTFERWKDGVEVDHPSVGLRDFARNLLAAAPTAPAGEPVTVTLDQHDREMTQVIEERDEYHDIADKLADAIAEHLGVEIGEHSSANCPWENALEAMANADPAQQPVSDPDGLRSAAAALLERLPTDDIGLAVFHAGDEVRALMDALTAPAPDEREIAADAVETAIEVATYADRGEKRTSVANVFDSMREYAKSLRAGKEGES